MGGEQPRKWSHIILYGAARAEDRMGGAETVEFIPFFSRLQARGAAGRRVTVQTLQLHI